MSEPRDIVAELRTLHAEIVESDGGECEMMRKVREAADTIEALRISEEALNRALKSEVELRNKLYDERVKVAEARAEKAESALAAAEAALANKERSHTTTIDQRDEAEEFASQVYFKIVGDSPEWSNNFGYDQALEDITDKFETLLSHVKERVTAEAAGMERAAQKADARRRWYVLPDTIAEAEDRTARTIAADIRSLIPSVQSPVVDESSTL